VSVFAVPTEGTRRSVPLPGPWLRELAVVAVDDLFSCTIGDGDEALALVLSGTFDLFAGGSSWLQRGLRATVFAGRPCGVYLPPKVAFRSSGRGELLLATGKRPPSGPAAAKPDRAAMPLLPLAGGKAFDSRSGTWELLERFPSSPEAVLPRAIETVTIGATRVERVFSYAFKAQTLCLDEAVVAEGDAVVLPRPLTPPGVRFGDELALFVRAPGECEVVQAEARTCRGDSVLVLAAEHPVEVRARRGACYVAAVLAGPKPVT